VIRVRDAAGTIVLDDQDPAHYLDLIEEEVKPWTYMKFPYLRSLGPTRAGTAWGRWRGCRTAASSPTPRAERERREFVDSGGGQPVHAALATHWARMIELLHAMEVIAELLDDRRLRSGPLTASRPACERRHRRHRSAARHADPPLPRGQTTTWSPMCNLIVSTTHNNQAMNEAVRAVARQRFDGRELTEGLLNEIEVAIRAYDPCLSCATHALGAMPLQVDLLAADGTRRDRLVRHGDGRVVHDEG
jgi:NAD-reducing hydrogenase large subunit